MSPFRGKRNMPGLKKQCWGHFHRDGTWKHIHTHTLSNRYQRPVRPIHQSNRSCRPSVCLIRLVFKAKQNRYWGRKAIFLHSGDSDASQEEEGEKKRKREIQRKRGRKGERNKEGAEEKGEERCVGGGEGWLGAIWKIFFIVIKLTEFCLLVRKKSKVLSQVSYCWQKTYHVKVTTLQTTLPLTVCHFSQPVWTVTNTNLIWKQQEHTHVWN